MCVNSFAILVARVDLLLSILYGPMQESALTFQAFSRMARMLRNGKVLVMVREVFIDGSVR